jgi:GNAT superfamily N-acetyltransferase
VTAAESGRVVPFPVEAVADQAGPVRIRRVRLGGLPAGEARRLFDRMGQVMVATLNPGGSADANWAARDWDRRWPAMRTCDAYLAEQDGRLVGFLAYETVRVARRRAVHLLAAYILPDYQGLGIAFSINARIVFRSLLTRPLADQVLVMDVLNPLAFRAWRVRVTDGRNFFPAVGGSAEPSPGLQRVARQVAADRYPSVQFDPASGVLRGKTLPRDGDPPHSGDLVVDRYFDRHVDASSGDTVLVVIDGNRRAVLDGLAQMVRAVPRSLRRIGR